MPRKQRTEGNRYRVVRGTSVRRSPKRGAAGFDEWIHYRPGDVVTDPPEHADVAGFLASGAWEPAEVSE